jgi:hypothetical protein
MDGAEQQRFERVAYERTIMAALAATRKWPRRKRDDAVLEFTAKVWDQWKRLLDRGKDPEPMLGSLLHWAKMWIRYDRRIGGRGRQPDLYDYRANMTRHLLDGRGRLRPHERSARINSFLDWSSHARTDDPGEMVAALEQVSLTMEEFLSA